MYQYFLLELGSTAVTQSCSAAPRAGLCCAAARTEGLPERRAALADEAEVLRAGLLLLLLYALALPVACAAAVVSFLAAEEKTLAKSICTDGDGDAAGAVAPNGLALRRD